MLNNLNPETPKPFTLIRLPRQGSCNSDIKPLARATSAFSFQGRRYRFLSGFDSIIRIGILSPRRCSGCKLQEQRVEITRATVHVASIICVSWPPMRKQIPHSSHFVSWAIARRQLQDRQDIGANMEVIANSIAEGSLSHAY